MVYILFKSFNFIIKLQASTSHDRPTSPRLLLFRNYIDDLGYKYRRKDPPYYKSKEESYTVRYVCVKSKCEALLSYDSAKATYMKSKNFTHKCNIEDHAPREIKTSINRVDSKKIEDKIREDLMKPVMALYEDMTKPSTEMCYKFSTFKNFATQVKEKFFPKINQNKLHELFNDNTYKDFLQCIYEGRCEKPKINNIEIAVIFFSRFGARRFAENTFFAIDGTFKYCPIGFYQLVTINILDKRTNQFIPCHYTLMNSKTENIYAQSISLLKTRLMTMYNVDWNPEVVMMDMELALQNAFKMLFKNVEIRSCYFHYVKALWTHAANFGLKKKHLIKKTRQLIQTFKVACHMTSFEEAQSFMESINKLLITQNRLQITGEKTAYKKFFAYVKKTYFTRGSPFAKHINHQEFLKDEKYIRTNNHCEGYHRRLAQRIKHPRSRLTYVMSILKSEAEYFEDKLVQEYRGQIDRKVRRPQDQEFISTTKRLIQAYLQMVSAEDDIILSPPDLPDLEDVTILDHALPPRDRNNDDPNIEIQNEHNGDLQNGFPEEREEEEYNIADEYNDDHNHEHNDEHNDNEAYTENERYDQYIYEGSFISNNNTVRSGIPPNGSQFVTVRNVQLSTRQDFTNQISFEQKEETVVISSVDPSPRNIPSSRDNLFDFHAWDNSREASRSDNNRIETIQ